MNYAIFTEEEALRLTDEQKLAREVSVEIGGALVVDSENCSLAVWAVLEEECEELKAKWEGIIQGCACGKKFDLQTLNWV